MLKRRHLLAGSGAVLFGFVPSSLAFADPKGNTPPEDAFRILSDKVAGLGVEPSALFERARGNINPTRVVNLLERDFNRAHSGELTDPSMEPLDMGDSFYAAAVGAIYLWFTGKEYTLAAELLGQSRMNQTVDSYYDPTYGYRLGRTTTVANLRSVGVPKTGSARFPNSGNIYNVDAYYAIHAFNYTKSASLVTIKDRYDYTDKAAYDGIASAAANTMYEAQRRGIIVPFRVSITV